MFYIGIMVTRGSNVNKFSLIVAGMTFLLDFGIFRVILCFILASAKFCAKAKKPTVSYALKKEILEEKKEGLETSEPIVPPQDADSHVETDNKPSTSKKDTSMLNPSKVYDKSIDVSNLNLLGDNANAPLRRTLTDFRLNIPPNNNPLLNSQNMDGQKDEAIEANQLFPQTEDYNPLILKDIIGTYNPIELSRLIKDWKKKSTLPTIEEINDEQKVLEADGDYVFENLEEIKELKSEENKNSQTNSNFN